MKIITHDGIFHSDDVVAYGLLKQYYCKGEVELLRTRSQDIIKNKGSEDVVIDVGGVYDENRLYFDHHHLKPGDVGYGLSSAGLVKEFLKKKGIVFPDFLENFVQMIDKNDNGLPGGDKKYSEWCSIFNPFFMEKSDLDLYFLRCVDVFLRNLEKSLQTGEDLLKLIQEDEATKEREKLSHKFKELGFKEFLKLARNQVIPGVVEIYDPAIPYKDLLTNPPKEHEEMLMGITHVIYPKRPYGWGATAVGSRENPREPKLPFPVEWRGKSGKELVDTICNTYNLSPPNNIDNSYFCHAAGFFFSSLEKGFLLEAIKAYTKDKDMEI